MLQIKKFKCDLDKLVKWSEKLQMFLNFGKYTGHGNTGEEYKMGDAVLGRTIQEKYHLMVT